MRKDPFVMLLDENNNENIIFYDENNNPLEFEQVALINIADDQYAILHPVNMGYSDDEVIAYSISVEGNNYELLEVEDDDLLEEIYNEYRQLFKKKRK